MLGKNTVKELEKLNETVSAQYAAVKKELERLRFMFDTTPRVCCLWDRNISLIECNEAAVKLFGLKDKREYIERYLEFMPKDRADGLKTSDKVRMAVIEAFEKGECTYEWMYCMPDGTHIPVENMLVRVPYEDDYVVAVYSRDLRERNRMTSEIEYLNSLIETSRRVSFILFDTVEDIGIKNALTESMGLLGQCAGADQIYIAPKDMVDGIMYCTCEYAWSSDPDEHGRGDILPGMRLIYGLDSDWDMRFIQAQCMNGPIDDFPPAIQNFFARFETKSVLVIPVFIQDLFWGLVGFSDYKTERYFTESEVNVLRSVSLMMAAAAGRGVQSAALREARNRTRLLTDSTPLGFNLWNANLENIATNETAVKLFELESQTEYLEKFSKLSPEYQPDGSRSEEKAAELLKGAFKKGYRQFEWMHQKPDGTPMPMEITLVRVDYGDGHAIAGYMRDLREYKKMATEIEHMIAEIEQRDYLLQIVYEALDILLRSEPDDFSNNLNHCMGMMASAISADRMCLFEYRAEDGELCCTQMYEQSVHNLPVHEQGQEDNAPYNIGTPTIKETLMRGGYIHSRIGNMPAADRDRLGAHGVLAVLLLPIFIRDEFRGAVGFDNCRSERLFAENEVSVMRSGCLLIADALLRNEYMLGVRDTSAKLKLRLEKAERENKAKSDLITGISHGMSTPLNAIIELSEKLSNKGGTNVDIGVISEKIHNYGSALLGIVDGLSDTSVEGNTDPHLKSGAV